MPKAVDPALVGVIVKHKGARNEVVARDLCKQKYDLVDMGLWC